MKIKKVIIQRNYDYREFIFDDKINLIYSKENSKGKTTLLRAILFGLGYNIPATDGIKTFDDFYIHIDLIEKSHQYSLERNGDIVTLNEENEKITYIVPEQIYELHSTIFKINDIIMLNNLLAIFYIDQEKGWTLLNRGIIIGKNRFNIEDFISTLSEKDVSSINNEIKKLEDEIRKYRSIKSIAEYKNENIIEEVTSYRKNDDNELYNKLNLLKMREVEIKNDIKDVSGILKDNKKLIDYLEKLDIYVKISDDSSIKLSKENILNYNENQIFYETRKKELEINLAKVKDEINRIEDELDDRNILFNVKTVADEVDDMLKDVNINESQMDKIIGQLTRRKQKLMNELHEILSENNKYLNEIYPAGIQAFQCCGIAASGIACESFHVLRGMGFAEGFHQTFVVDALYLDLLGTAQDGGQDFLRLVAHQKEIRLFRRFFDEFEQLVGAFRIHFLRHPDNHGLTSAQGGFKCQFPLYLGGFGRIDECLLVFSLHVAQPVVQVEIKPGLQPFAPCVYIHVAYGTFRRLVFDDGEDEMEVWVYEMRESPA